MKHKNLLNNKKIKLVKSQNISTPILILCFDRPDYLKVLLKDLEKYNVKYIYISQDGCSNTNKKAQKKHSEVRQLIKEIKWTKNVKTNFFKTNLGKKIAPPKGIDWFFKKVYNGIILEDDTIPSKSFLLFSEKLLKKHSRDKKIFQICGSGALSKEFGNITYISSLPFMHGWATWRDRWKRYSFKIKNYSNKIDNIKNFKKSKNFKKNVPLFFGRLFWLSLFKEFNEEKHKTWDYQIVKYCVYNNFGCIKPSFNMITNIGYHDKSHVLSQRKKIEIKDFNHLKNMKNNFESEKSSEGWIFYSLSLRYRFSLLVKFIFRLI